LSLQELQKFNFGRGAAIGWVITVLSAELAVLALPPKVKSKSTAAVAPPLDLVGATKRRASKSPAKYDPAVSTKETFY
jgi:hypothetical protein